MFTWHLPGQASTASSLGEATSGCTTDSTSVTAVEDAASSSLGWVGPRPSEGRWGHSRNSKPGSTSRDTCRWSLSLIHTGATFPSPSSLPRCTKLQSRAWACPGAPFPAASWEAPAPQRSEPYRTPCLGNTHCKRSLGGSYRPLPVPPHATTTGLRGASPLHTLL